MSDPWTGYARVSTEEQDVAAQRADLPLAVDADHMYVNHGVMGTDRAEKRAQAAEFRQDALRAQLDQVSEDDAGQMWHT